jgi:hypothetical protein
MIGGREGEDMGRRGDEGRRRGEEEEGEGDEEKVEEKVEAKRPSLDSSGWVRWSSGQLPRNATDRCSKLARPCSSTAAQHKPRDAVDGGQERGETKRRKDETTRGQPTRDRAAKDGTRVPRAGLAIRKR